MSKKMSKEEWGQRQVDLIQHHHDLETAIARLEAYGKGETTECHHLRQKLDLTKGAIKLAGDEARGTV